MTKAQAYDAFWQGFGVFSEENTEPDRKTVPESYGTYEFADSDFDDAIALTASWYTRSDSWATANDFAGRLSRAIGRDGVIIPYTGGAIHLTRGTPFAQHSDDPEDDKVRRVIFNLNAEFLSAD